MRHASTRVAPLRIRSTGESGRRVTWLELFFDLVFVAAVAQVAGPLRQDYSIGGLVRVTPLLALIWCAWTGHSLFSTRFDTDDLVQRALTLVQMFVVAVMAANARDALDSRSSAGFAAAYAGVRFILVAQYLRARHVQEARPLTIRYLAGHGSAAVLWLASALIPAPARFWTWGLAFIIDLGTPWLAIPHTVRVPPDAAHLPERFGLFTLILLGESVVAVMQGMESQEDWTPAAAICAFAGMAILFLIWWWYFDGAAGASEQPVRTRRDAIRFQVWSYAHFPLSLGIVIVGVGIQRIVTAASRTTLPASDAAILMAGAAMVMLAIGTIAACGPRPPRRRFHDALATTALTGATFAVGTFVRGGSPVWIVLSLSCLCALQVAHAFQTMPDPRSSGSGFRAQG
jgi:low temperature requirement protein LtrA